MAENRNRDVYHNENLEQGNNPDEKNKKRTGKKTKGRKGSSDMATRENTSSQGYGSSQRKQDTNIAPLDADLNELPSKSRTPENNKTGPGLG